MKIDLNITAHLSVDDIKQIIKDYLEKEGYEVSNIKPKITTKTMGHQMNEYTESVFDGIEAKIVKKK